MQRCLEHSRSCLHVYTVAHAFVLALPLWTVCVAHAAHSNPLGVLVQQPLPLQPPCLLHLMRGVRWTACYPELLWSTCPVHQILDAKRRLGRLVLVSTPCRLHPTLGAKRWARHPVLRQPPCRVQLTRDAMWTA